MDYRISWLFGAGFAVVNNFVGLKYFVFKKKEAINDN
jgi:putative flippase GtrA